MGVNSKAVLTKNGLSPLEVMDFLNKLDHVSQVSITPALKDFCRINFTWSGEARNLAVFYNGDCHLLGFFRRYYYDSSKRVWWLLPDE